MKGGKRLIGTVPFLNQEGEVMPARKLMEYLESNHIFYEAIPHTQTFTAQKTAQSTHISGLEMAKTVIVRIDGQLSMVVLPANYRVNLARLREATGARSVDLAHEQDFEERFPECEIGAMPPFGNLYDMPVFVDAHLTKDEDIAFNAGTHTEVIKMHYKDFDDLVHPEVDDFTD
jgi:Ala-tRNA(Pro) deacylase